jgi:hypothetical protein
MVSGGDGATDANKEPAMTPDRCYSIDFDRLTVIMGDGERDHDLNADGEPCATMGDLRSYIVELYDNRVYDAGVRDHLLRATHA